MTFSASIPIRSGTEEVSKQPFYNLIPTFRAVYQYDALAEALETTASFVEGGNSFITKGPGPYKDSLLLAAGLSFINKRGFQLSGNYSYEYSKGFSGHSYELKARLLDF